LGLRAGLGRYGENKIFFPHWGSNTDRPAHVKSLYQLHYPGKLYYRLYLNAL
jgi:hypothetical protein